jgi:hypothetical protein
MRVDLDHRRVGFDERRVDGGQHFRELVRHAPVEPHAERELAGLERHHAHAGVDDLAQDFFRVGGGHFLDVHAAGGAGNHHGAGAGAVDDDAQIELALDLHPFLDQHPAHLLAFGPGLVRDQGHPQHVLRQLLGLADRAGHLHAAALAAAAGMNLRLDDTDLAAEAARDVGRFTGRKGHFAARHGHSVAREHGLGLIFVDFHRGCVCGCAGEKARGQPFIVFGRNRDRQAFDRPVSSRLSPPQLSSFVRRYRLPVA